MNLRLCLPRAAKMEKEVRERFERIEQNLEYASLRIADITAAHLELETAQANSQKTIDRVSSKLEDVTQRLANLTILVDRLIERDFCRN
jgi:hypothetical protein